MENKQYKDNMNKTEQIIKRSVDFVIAACCLIFFSPLAIACAIAIRLEDGLPVIYRQERIGLHGKPFFIYKFRSMKIDAEKDGPDLLEIKGDPRLTKVGRFLRMHHLDELPQLWNVFIGDMSLVGPRPEVKKYTDLYTEEQKQVLHVRPGITDWASIKYVDENKILGESKTPDEAYVNLIMPNKIKLNMVYIQNQTLGEYFKIIFTTFKEIVR